MPTKKTATATPRRIEYMPIDDLQGAEHNPKGHDKPRIANSISRFGFADASILDERTGRLVAGHGRHGDLLARREQGKEPPEGVTVDEDGRWLMPVQRGWASRSDEDAAAFLVAHNRLTETGGWDDQGLLELLENINDVDPELLDLTGYTLDDIDDLHSVANAGEPVKTLDDPDDVPVTPDTPISSEGDVYLLGPHRVACGSGTDPDVVAAALGGATADAFITDPPYNVNYTGKTADALQIDNDEMEDAAFRSFLTELFTAALERTKPGGPIYVFHADTEGVNFRQAFVDAGWDLKQVLVWIKSTFALGRQDHHWQHEPILYGWRPGAAHAWYGGRALTTLLEFDKPSRNAEHPTMKPVALLASLLDRSTRPGDRVLDTCAGSGSIAIAAHGSARVAAMVELDPRYVDVICRRYQEHTGTLPVLEASGEERDFVVRTD